MLKYAPQLSIDKDISGAYVIGRRTLGFKEDIPENYERLLKDKAYLEFALKKYEEREKELNELLVEGVRDRVRSRLVPVPSLPKSVLLSRKIGPLT